MADHDQTPVQTESTPLTTTLEPTTPEEVTTTETTPTEVSTNPETAQATPQATNHAAEAVLPQQPVSPSRDEPEYDADDFAKALESFDREQAAEKDVAQSLTAEEALVTGTVVKITDKHVVVDIGLKSEGLIPLEQVVDHTGTPKFNIGDTVEVVVEREEQEGGYLVSYEKALRHKVWDKLEEAANTKTPVKGMVVSRVKGGLTVDIGIKAFLPGSQVEVRPVRNLDGYIGQELEVRVIKLNKKRGNV